MMTIGAEIKTNFKITFPEIKRTDWLKISTRVGTSNQSASFQNRKVMLLQKFVFGIGFKY